MRKYLRRTIDPTRKIGTSQLMSRSIPKIRLLAIAPILPKQTDKQIAIAPTCVGKMSTTTPLSAKFAVAIASEKIQDTIRF